MAYNFKKDAVTSYVKGYIGSIIDRSKKFPDVYDKKDIIESLIGLHNMLKGLEE